MTSSIGGRESLLRHNLTATATKMSEPASADAAAPPPADPTPTEPPPPPVNPEEERRQKVLADYRKVLLQHKETEAKVKQSASRAPFPSFAPAGKK